MEHYSASLQQPGNSLNLAMTNNAMIGQSSLDHDLDQQTTLNLAAAQQGGNNRYMNQRDKVLMYQLNQYYLTKSTARSKSIARTIQEVVKIVHDVLRELEIQEPRFISTFTETNGHYEGELCTLHYLEHYQDARRQPRF